MAEFLRLPRMSDTMEEGVIASIAIKVGDTLNPGDLIGEVETFGEKSIHRGKLFQVIFSDKTGFLTLTWFNGVRFIKNLFKVGDRYAIHGKIDWYNGPSITHPEFDKINLDDDPISTGVVVPLYP